MRKILVMTAAGVGLAIASPVLVAQTTAPPPPADPTAPMPPDPAAPDPANPNPTPMPDPSAPPQPAPQPVPPEMPTTQAPPPAAPGRPANPVVVNRDAPIGPMATPPGSGANSAQSGGTTSAMMQPQPATKEYPPCTKTLQDNCRNPGEGPKAAKPKKRGG